MSNRLKDKLAVCLASDESAYMTGAIHVIGGD